MCWGTYCSGKGGQFKTLHYDANPKEAKNRRTANGCLPRPNRCSSKKKGSKFPKGYSCDEFPFASVKEADGTTHLNRCVPENENNSQGGQLSALYRNKCGKKACAFDMAFENFPSTSYCNAKKADFKQVCKNKAAIFTSSNPKFVPATKVADQEFDGARGLAANDPTKFKRAEHPHTTLDEDRNANVPAVYEYKLSNGAVVTSFNELEMGAETYQFDLNGDLELYDEDKEGEDIDDVNERNADKFTVTTHTIVSEA